MYRRRFALVLLLALVPALWAGDSPPARKDKASSTKSAKSTTPAQQYQALVREYQKKLIEFNNAYRLAQTSEQRQKLLNEKYPKPQDYSGRLIELAEQNPKAKFAPDALAWVVAQVRFGPDVDKAVDLLVRDHMNSRAMASVCQTLGRTGGPNAEEHLRTILEKNKNKDVQANACLSLAQVLKRRTDREQGISDTEREKVSKEAEGLFERVIKQYANGKNVRGNSLAETAKTELFELQHLSIGKKAPQIVGPDIDGRPMKLSDYRGKVVVLDFWGNW